MPTIRLLIALTVALGTPAFAQDDQPTTMRTDDVRTIRVLATEFEFEPSTIEVEKGERVRIVLHNKGTIAHNLALSGDERTETIQPGKTSSFEFTADEAGSIHFECKVQGHAQVGMTGEVKVSE